MSFIAEEINWDASVYSIDTTDQLLGGVTGPMNKAAQNLANRTQWLKNALQGYVGVNSYTANHTFLPSELLYQLVLLNANTATLTFTLPNSADLTNPIGPGFTAFFKAVNVNQSQVTLQTAGSDKILDGSAYDPSGLRTKVYLGDGDTIKVVLTTSGWMIADCKGNFDDIGGILQRYKQLPNTLIAQGQLVNRADYPRLWEYVQTLGASLVTDAVWVSGLAKHGFYSTGNTTTTFRVPDLRGMFLRNLDLSAGIDLGRPSNAAGDYEADDFKAHDHSVPPIPLEFEDVDRGVNHSDFSIDNVDGSKRTGLTGGLETRPKNMGLLPLIKV
jgi:hypothetical protein